MRTLLKAIGWMMLAGIAVSVVVVIACIAWGLPYSGHTEVSFDGDAIAVSSLSIGAVLLALAVGLVMLLVAVAAPLLVVGIVLVGVVLALAGVATVLCSPLLLLAGLVWLIWRVSRGRPAGATIER